MCHSVYHAVERLPTRLKKVLRRINYGVEQLLTWPNEVRCECSEDVKMRLLPYVLSAEDKGMHTEFLWGNSRKKCSFCRFGRNNAFIISNGSYSDFVSHGEMNCPRILGNNITYFGMTTFVELYAVLTQY